MSNWQKSLRSTTSDVAVVAEQLGLSAEEVAGARAAADEFSFRVTPYYLALAREVGAPLLRQCVPDVRELAPSPHLVTDPLAEERHTPVACIVHRYPDRCLFLVSGQCAMHCRFCTRKRKTRSPLDVSEQSISAGIEYIRSRPEIRDVLISGGDPLLLDDARLDTILRQLRTIKHVEIIRIGTRTPCVLPERITTKLTAVLKRYHPLFVNVHFNHPDELTPQAVAALSRLADTGIPLGNQTVLLAGVNDNADVMRRLVHRLLAARVRPYYLHMPDLVYGTEHFRTPREVGLQIIDSLRGWTSGLAVPHLVIDLPHGGGKVTLQPEYLQEVHGSTLTFRNYCGDCYEYRDV
ncbi:MAG: KamA family radical SAM protein [Thermoguttaceae bacterium]